jgi:ketosteroid isomerase-like protein
MERSSGVEDVIRQMWASIGKGDAQAVTDLIAPIDEVLWIGTDPEEWWSGADKAKTVIEEQLRATGGFDVAGTNPSAFVDGDVAWVADRGVIRLPDATEIPIRATGVLRRHERRWRIVQFHASIGVANDQVLGTHLPT